MITKKDLAEKYGYTPNTIAIFLCRSEFSCYLNRWGRIIAWDDIAERRLKRVIALKQRGRT